ncbi:phage GP46 family protein [Enterobacter ludwigii]|uniref:phage GP46 family protein n=1 Tax=Enterobacter ludwigii TaxID=299767 RepID=UPI003BEED685
MDALIDTRTGNYTGSQTSTLQNAVYLRLTVPLGSWWADPTLGSRLYLLKREKDVARVRTLARQYAEQALQPILDDGRASSITVTANHPANGLLILLIEVTQANGEVMPFTHYVQVG